MRPSALAFMTALTLSGCIVVPVPLPGPQVDRSVARPDPSTVAANDVNAYRRAAGVAPVARSAALDRAAARHARDMNRNDFMDHRGTDGSSHSDRIRAVGCPGGAENVADGPYTRQSVMQAWMESPGHRRNILNSRMTRWGLAQSGDKWAMVLSPC